MQEYDLTCGEVEKAIELIESKNNK
jgi:hypothetical protein